MAKEVLELEVKTNITSATKEADSLASSLQRATSRASGLDKELSAVGTEGSKELSKAESTATKLEQTLGKVTSESSKLSKGLGKNMGKAGVEANSLTGELEKSESAVKSTKEETKGLTEELKKSKKAVKGAQEETKGLAKETEDVGKAAKSSGGGVKKLGKGFGTLVKSLGIIGLIAAAFTALKEALERNQKVMDVVNTIMTTISTTFNQVVDVLTDTIKWVTESSDRFDGLGKVLGGLVTLSLTPLKLAFYGLKLGVQEVQLAWEKWIGGADPQKMAELRAGILETANALEDIAVAAIDAGKDIGANIGDAIGEIGAMGKMAIDGISKISIKSNYELAKATTAAANSSKLAEAQIQGLIEKNDRLAELQRHIRDSEKATFAERIAANKEIAEILDKQEVEMLKLADTRIASAALELSANKDNIELQVAYMQTLNDRAGVEAQIAGFRSEQLTNQESLEKELGEIQKEIAQDSIDGIDRELLELENAYNLKLEMAKKANVSDLELTEQYLKEKQAIIDAAGEVETKKQEDIDKAVLSAKVALTKQAFGVLGELAGENLEAGKAVAVAETIFNTQQGIMAAMGATSVADKLLPFPLRLANAIGVGLMGASAVKTILSTSAGSGGGGGGGVPSASSVPPAPQMMSGAFELEGGQEVEPQRAYVVSDDITDSQNGLAIIRRRATI